MSEEQELMRQVIRDVSEKLNRLAVESHEDVVWRTNTDNAIRGMAEQVDKIAQDLTGDNHTPGLKTTVMLQQTQIAQLTTQLAKVDAMHERQDEQDATMRNMSETMKQNAQTLAGVKKLFWTILTAIVTGGASVMFTIMAK